LSVRLYFNHNVKRAVTATTSRELNTQREKAVDDRITIVGRPLVESNPYLRDPVARRRAILRNAETSSAIEGIRAPFRELRRELLSEEAESSGERIKHRTQGGPGESRRSRRG
jgi:hypothetical protein